MENIEVKEYLKTDFENNHLLKKFLEIPDCPKRIFAKGNFPEKHLRTLAIVGSRNISSYGKDVLEKLIEGLAGNHISIISGLALGVDAYAHKLALKYNIHTIAIPGSGLSKKVLYPKANLQLASDILENQGLFLSEFNLDTKAAPWTFPARNRLMAALADAILIIEASPMSGTLITARFAIDYNKDVLAVPGSIFSKNSEGTNKLISEGAKIIVCADDILECFGMYKANSENLDKKENNENFSEDELEILNILKENRSKDKIIELSGKNPSDILVTLSLLEWRGYIKEEFGMIRRVK